MISVCMATYNGEKYIKEQIDSILCQLKEDDELIISDDGSKDTTLHIINSFKDNRIKIFPNKGGKGFVRNFENAIKHSTGDYIFLCDQDDIWMSNKVEKVLKQLQEYDLIVHDAELIGAEGESLQRNYYSTLHTSKGFFMNLWKTRFLGCCMAFRRELKKDIIPFPKNTVGHDYWIGMYALSKYKVLFMEESLIYYRRHGNNASSSSEGSNNTFLYKIFVKRLPLLMNIIRRSILKA